MNLSLFFKNKFFLNNFITKLLVKQINLKILMKFKKLKNTSLLFKNRKNISRIKTILKIKYFYENFKR